MKRWLLSALIALLVVTSIGTFYLTRITSSSPPRYHLVRTVNSAYKYHLCGQAFASNNPESPFGTDYTFHDPFRNTNDTIVPLLLKNDIRDDSVSFSVKIIVNQVAIYNESITHIHESDGISILLPDTNEQLQRSNEPQIIIDTVNRSTTMAVLDYTCPEQWVWKTTSSS